MTEEHRTIPVKLELTDFPAFDELKQRVADLEHLASSDDNLIAVLRELLRVEVSEINARLISIENRLTEMEDRMDPEIELWK